MDFIRLLKHYKLSMIFCLFIYILFWFTVGIFEQSRKLNVTSVSYRKNPSIANIYFILEYLSKFHINLLLIDPFVLDYLFIRHLSFQQLQKPLITFGISYDSIQTIHSLFFVRKFSLTISKSFNNTSIDHIFIEYNQQFIHLAVLYEENSYFLIRKNTVQLPIDIKLSYGDTLRVIELSELQFVKDKFSFAYPRNVSHFLWLYDTSEFLECNRTLADQMEKEFYLYQNARQVNLTILPMRNIVYILNKLKKHYWLAGGTLLGKKY
ncbi:unnamed protein product [Rotaria sp. Silwood1]|nr:unnamed protein product [Rotaria sp. Silwood1]